MNNKSPSTNAAGTPISYMSLSSPVPLNKQVERLTEEISNEKSKYTQLLQEHSNMLMEIKSLEQTVEGKYLRIWCIVQKLDTLQ